MAAVLALLITVLLNAGVIPQPHAEDEFLVSVMGQIAIDAVVETTDCDVEADPIWDFNADAVGGLQIVGIANPSCEIAGQFYRSPEDHQWSFEVAGS